MTSTPIVLKAHTSGDTWRGLSLTLTLNDLPMDLTGARVDMQMRKLPSATAALYTWSSAGVDPTITITDALGGAVSIAKRVVTSICKLHFDVQVTTADGDVRTVLSGELPIVEDVTRV